MCGHSVERSTKAQLGIYFAGHGGGGLWRTDSAMTRDRAWEANQSPWDRGQDWSQEMEGHTQEEKE